MIGSVFPRYDTDDQVPWLRQMCGQLRAMGVEVEYLAPAHKGLKSHTIDGMVVHRFRYAPAGMETLTGEEGAPNKVRRNPFLKFLAVAYLWCGFWTLVKLLCQKKYDVVEVHWPFPHAFMALPAVWAGVPVVYHYYTAEMKLAGAGAVSRWAFALSLGWARAHVAISSYARGLVQEFDKKINPVVIPYGSPINFVETPRADRPLRKILFVGRHIERKGGPYLIEAIKSLPTDYSLTIVGEGDQTQAWKKLAEGEGRIVFAGRLSNEELAAAYQTHDIFVLPAIVDSRGDTEGLGVVLVEAIGAGMPVVASNIGGIPDVIEEGKTGLMVEPKNAAALAAAIKRLGDDGVLGKKMAAAAKEKVAREFAWGAVAEKMKAVYESVRK